MRFDDSLTTVLAADTTSAFGAQAAFRQIVDLIARRRIDATPALIEQLETLRPQVSMAVRAAAARSLALAEPPLALVAFFITDAQEASGAALRAARLGDRDWCALLPSLGPVGRSVLRGRDDLGEAVNRALETFGATDFSLGYDGAEIAKPFTDTPALTEAPGGGFEIASLVDRLAAFQRDRDGGAVRPVIDPAPAAVPTSTDRFAFETDAGGMIRWVDAEPRAAVVGIGFMTTGSDGRPQVDGVASGAFRHRTGFDDARLTVSGGSALAGDWRISGVPLFDPASGRFGGFRGEARRPRIDEGAMRDTGGTEGLRRLVHELRTPAGAIAGFSELIEREMMGPVPPVYRERAATIRALAGDLVAAIEDLEMAARIAGDALDLRDGIVAVKPLLDRVMTDLSPLVTLRNAALVLINPAVDLTFACDDRAVERLVGRLLATLVAAAQPGERIEIEVREIGVEAVIAITRPAALTAVSDAGLLTLDAEREADLPGAPLLGTGFALRLARNLAAELGGALSIDATRLTLALPAGLIDGMGQASTN